MQDKGNGTPLGKLSRRALRRTGGFLRAGLDKVLRTGLRSRAAAIGLICLVCLVAAGRLNFAVAVSMDGDLVGYVANRQELDAIVESVKETASGALGYDWNAPALTCRMAFGSVSEDLSAQVADRLYSSIDGLGKLQLLYVDGQAVRAYETRAEAVSAVESLREAYVNETTDSVRFAQDVTIAGGIASLDLLETGSELDDALAVVTTERLTTETELPYDTLFITDMDMFADERRVLVNGCSGLESTEYLLTRENGKLTDYTALGSTVLREPVNEVVKVGSRIRRSTGEYQWPVGGGQLTSTFGYRRIGIGSSYHMGIDIGDSYGCPIYAADGGIVIFADTYNGYGLLLQVQHDNGDITYYAHCSQLLVSVGDVVAQGETIAEMGCTGVATGVHLHFELRPGGGDAVDPLSYLPEGVITEEYRPYTGE